MKRHAIGVGGVVGSVGRAGVRARRRRGGHQSGLTRSSRAVFLARTPQEVSSQTSLAPGRRVEPVHLHGVKDTSVHLVLPMARGKELVQLGWAEAHQYPDFGTEFIIYGPREEGALEAVVSVIEESLAFAREPAESAGWREDSVTPG